MKTTLYVMSATGNSLYAAQKLAQSLGESEIVLLPSDKPVILTERIGIIGPVYDGFPSPPVVDFLRGPFRQADKSQVKYLFCLHTCGKSPTFAPHIIEKLVTEAGCAPSYQNSVRMIDTHVGMVPIRAKLDWKPILDKADGKLARIATEIGEGALRIPSRRPLAGFALRFLMPKAHHTCLPVMSASPAGPVPRSAPPVPSPWKRRNPGSGLAASVALPACSSARSRRSSTK